MTEGGVSARIVESRLLLSKNEDSITKVDDGCKALFFGEDRCIAEGGKDAAHGYNSELLILRAGQFKPEGRLFIDYAFHTRLTIVEQNQRFDNRQSQAGLTGLDIGLLLMMGAAGIAPIEAVKNVRNLFRRNA